MGLLKIALMYLSTVHTYLGFRGLRFSSVTVLRDLGFKVTALSTLESNLMSFIVSVNVALGFLAFASSVMGSGARGKIGMAFLIIYGMLSWHAYNDKVFGDEQKPLLIVFGNTIFLIVSLIIHMFEPGIFTKPKRRGSKSS